MNNQLLLEKIKERVDKWRDRDYEGIFKETNNILAHIKKVGFLHTPQIEALETYIFLKEVLGNKSTSEMISKLYSSDKELIDILTLTKDEKYELAIDDNRSEKIKAQIEKEYGQFSYPNQVYALTMGSGKTILMGAMMLYEFILSTYHQDDKRFSKNILVFAPDTTIIESLKEIKTFDYTTIIPKEYENVVLNIKYHYLESVETPVNFIGNYNVIVSNSQKIILKKKNNLLKSGQLLLNETERAKQHHSNERREAIRRLSDLAIFVDEAHHSYGTNLDNSLKRSRETINYLNEEGNTPLVNVVNLTGTPYVNNKLIPDVVYHFGLKQGIEQGILKQVRFIQYENVKSNEFVEDVINTFLDKYKDTLLEGKLPKIAFYSSSIEDLQQNLKPAIEKALTSKKVSLDKILEYHTEKEENKDEFNKLDKVESDKQFILLVGKGTEGWNVRSLVATALFRKPTSPIFVLQASTRCMRSIGDNSTPARIFLSDENASILDKELQKNFALTRADLEEQKAEKIDLTLEVLKKKKIKVKKEIRELESVYGKDISDIKLSSPSEYLKFSDESYRKEGGIYLDSQSKSAVIKRNQSDEKLLKKTSSTPISHIISQLSIRTHIPCLNIKEILQNNKIDFNELEKAVSQSYDYLLSVLSEVITQQLFEYKESVEIVEEELELTKQSTFKLTRDKDKESLIVYKQERPENRLGFHINPYSFDTEDEKSLFNYFQETLEPDESVTDLYFTGNISETTKTDFYFEYFNPNKQAFAKYFPDFLIETNKGRFIVIEVKGENEKADYQQNKKRYEELDDKSLYNEVYSKEVGFREFQRVNNNFDYHIIFNARLQQKQRELLDKVSKEIKNEK